MLIQTTQEDMIMIADSFLIIKIMEEAYRKICFLSHVRQENKVE